MRVGGGSGDGSTTGCSGVAGRSCGWPSEGGRWWCMNVACRSSGPDDVGGVGLIHTRSSVRGSNSLRRGKGLFGTRSGLAASLQQSSFKGLTLEFT